MSDQHTGEKATLTSDERRRILSAYRDGVQPPGEAVLIEAASVARQHEIEATANTLAVAAVLLRKVAAYWDGRPLTHHGQHIYADLMDVLRAIEADEKHNRERLIRPKTTGADS